MLALVSEHLTNQQIAGRLHLSVRTVESHVSSLLRKLGVADRRALTMIARHRAGAGPLDTAASGRRGTAHTADLLRGPVRRARRPRGRPRRTSAGHRGRPGRRGQDQARPRRRRGRRWPALRWCPLRRPGAGHGPRDGGSRAGGRFRVRGAAGAVARRRRWSPSSPAPTCSCVLDNCEHLLDGVSTLVERLLAACPRVVVLATSRARLRVPFEFVFPVPGCRSREARGRRQTRVTRRHCSASARR